MGLIFNLIFYESRCVPKEKNKGATEETDQKQHADYQITKP
jgi:uncharacterized protein (UPF0332 family)